MLGEHPYWSYCTTTGYHGWFSTSSPSPPALKEKSDDGFGSDDTDEDDGASFSNNDKLTA